ncbi:MAG: Enoyl-CoA hydratase/isomerase [Candidatus Aramenus sulfurataquae]|jgi:enoyl-CoA hydratase/carnithine racemase|uniref:Enoyl-CoA hydratase n=2 Tax=Candidatus Aramenus sulfurataquae TaxID=1326980 RepID=W7KL67_9CREN|nr:MAG: Enoyl-CoA hydratase/isomerase [Candidatus Aramenus sulfurataquae]MCL7343571.1 enoyl-CoA hydratase/isomerase family protein [Candidatus Aramenus sulfurataquae]
MYVNLEDRGKYAIIRFNTQTRYNLVNEKFMLEMIEALERVSKERSLRFVIFKGENGNFGAGADIRELMKVSGDLSSAKSFFGTMKAMYESIMKLEKVTIAQVEGIAYGASLEMLLVMDFAVADEKARFAAPGGKIGVFPPVLIGLGPRIIGYDNVRRLAMLGEEIGAEEAKRIGLIHSYGNVEEETKKVVAALSSFAPTSLAVMRRNIFADSLQVLDRVFDDLISQVVSDDARNGINAFLAKLKPSWDNLTYP